MQSGADASGAAPGKSTALQALVKDPSQRLRPAGFIHVKSQVEEFQFLCCVKLYLYVRP